MIKTLSEPEYMSRENEQYKNNPKRLSGFSLNPDLADCPGNPEERPPCETTGQSEPHLPLREFIQNELRGISLNTQVNAINVLLLRLEKEDASFKKKIYGNHLEYRPTDCLYKNCFSDN